MMNVEHGLSALKYPVFRALCPELSDEEFEGMRTVVCGWLFGRLEIPEA
jgi:hypothetical protein